MTSDERTVQPGALAVPVTLQLARGGVVRETVLRAASGGHDLIVLGGDHRRGVARRVIRRAGVPVVIVDDSAEQATALDMAASTTRTS